MSRRRVRALHEQLSDFERVHDIGLIEAAPPIFYILVRRAADRSICSLHPATNQRADSKLSPKPNFQQLFRPDKEAKPCLPDLIDRPINIMPLSRIYGIWDALNGKIRFARCWCLEWRPVTIVTDNINTKLCMDVCYSFTEKQQNGF
ncbi:hypothetical protein TNCV_2686681 [Trichonephila clavipes]|nr:hypothetical protein TNCV_2686681 [Trichonephila clavipes]